MSRAIKPQAAGTAPANPERQLLHPAENIQRFEARQHCAIQNMIRVQALMLCLRDHLKARHGDDADEEFLAMLEMAWESATDAIEILPPLSVLTSEEGGAS